MDERKWREVHGEELGQPMTFFAISNRGDTRRRLEEIIIPQRALWNIHQETVTRRWTSIDR